MTYDELVKRLNDAAGERELRRIERESGVNYGTIRGIKDGQTKNPRIDTFDALCEWCQRNPAPHVAGTQ